MGSKKHKKESKKRKHHSRSESRSPIREEKERRKHKKRHHKERKKEKHVLSKKVNTESSNSDDDVIYVPPPPKISKLSVPSSPPKISKPSAPSPPTKTSKPAPSPPPPPTITIEHSPSPPPPPPPSISKSAMGGSSEQSISIEETNALRAKLGLKPLSVTPKEPPATESNLVRCPETNVEFVHKPAEDLTQKKLSEKIRTKLAVRKEKREIEKKLSAIKGLGEDSDKESSAASWVKKSRKLEEERLKAQLKAKELDEMDEEFGIGDLVAEEIQKEKVAAYTGADLRGLKVEHDMDSFTEGKSVILTLKDKGVLEEEGDALVNVNMIDEEKYKKNVLNKKMKPYGYNAVDNGEMDVDDDEGVLSKYDEEIDGIKKSSFTLGETNSERTKMRLKNMLKEDRRAKLESLATSELKLASDYYAPEEMKIKRPKKKKKLRSRILKTDDLLADAPDEKPNHRSLKSERGIIDNPLIKVESEDPMDLDGISQVPVLGAGDVKVEEESDTELELALKKARRLKQMPTEFPKKLPKIEEVLGHVTEETEDDAGMSAIVLNSTAEFCRTLGDIPTYGMAGNRDEDPSLLLDYEKADESKKKRQEEYEDRGGWNEVDMDDKLVETKQIEGTILDAEPDLGAGVAGALRLAVSKGYLEKETTSRPSASRFAHLAAQNYSIDDKAHAMEDDKFGRRERYLGPTMDFKERDSYKPNIKLEYIDDEGHLLSAKEAFRYLSHKFHGKGPGKNKVEKRMKKSEQEVLMKQMSSSDTPLGTLNMLQHKQKETQSAFVVLSGSKALTTPAAISKTKVTK